jgi:citrate lyase subunit beta/citryl-CoA lyase
MLAKAATLDVDMAFIDLEDSVPAAAKTDATRNLVVEALTGYNWQAGRVAVRINPVDGPWWTRDVETLVRGAGERIASVVIPKVEGTTDIQAVDRQLSEIEASLGLKGQIELEAQIESARGLVELEAIATASPRLTVIVFGPGDYAASLGLVSETIGKPDARYPGDQWHYVRSRIATVAHAFGLQPIDGPYAAVTDSEGLRESATLARLVGFEGKWVIHPDQIAICNEVFSPTNNEVEWARQVINVLDRAEGTDRAAVRHGGVMIDTASRRVAEALLDRARAAGVIS